MFVIRLSQFNFPYRANRDLSPAMWRYIVTPMEILYLGLNVSIKLLRKNCGVCIPLGYKSNVKGVCHEETWRMYCCCFILKLICMPMKSSTLRIQSYICNVELQMSKKKPVFEVTTRLDSNKPAHLHRLASVLEFLAVVTICILLPIKHQTTKVLIKLQTDLLLCCLQKA